MTDVCPALVLCQTPLLRVSRKQSISNQPCEEGDDGYQGTKEDTEASKNYIIGLKLWVSQ